MNEDKASPLVGVILLVLSLVLVVGIQTFAGPCSVQESGSVSSCHWAARAVWGAGIVIVVLSIVRVFERDEGERRGLSFAAACVGALVACLPGVLIGLCAAPDVRCHVVMQPFAMGLGVAIALVGGVDLIVRLMRIGSAK